MKLVLNSLKNLFIYIYMCIYIYIHTYIHIHIPAEMVFPELSEIFRMKQNKQYLKKPIILPLTDIIVN